MKKTLFCMALLSSSFLLGSVQESILPLVDTIYNFDFGKKINARQKENTDDAILHQDETLRVMTYNMLYNDKSAEALLPPKHHWDIRKDKLFEYLIYSSPDLIGSQELQEDQVQDVMNALGDRFQYYGEKTRENEGRTDTNAIFFNPERLELLDSKTISYQDPYYENKFTYCYFHDKLLDKNFSAINTKLTWGNVERRLAEALQLNQFVANLPSDEPIILMGDFNTFPFLEHKKNFYFDGDYIVNILTETLLKDARNGSVFGHFGPLCSITNSKTTLAPFVGPELSGFILDHIFINDQVSVFTHGIDTAKVDGEYPSDHFPVIVDLHFNGRN